MLRNLILGLMFTCLVSIMQAQTIIDTVYRLEEIQKSTSFASMTVGADILSISGASINLNNQNIKTNQVTIPRISIGGLHFWGHADFYVTFPLGLSFGRTPIGTSEYSLFESVETGMKIYPFALSQGKLRPYLGVSFQQFSFKYTPDVVDYPNGGSTYSEFISPLHVGLTYASNKYLFNAGLRYTHQHHFNYYYSPDQQAKVVVMPFNFSIGFTRYFDTSKSLGTPKEIDQLNIKHYLLEKHNKINAWYWAIGPSTALQMSKSSYFEKYHPYFSNQMTNSSLLPEISFGRYFHKTDMNISSSFRTMGFSLDAFDTKIKMRRTSLAVEAYKFLFDYHGFVPFIGPSIGIDRISYNENGTVTAETKPAVGVVFGWDIRVSQTGTSLLRTNLRYMPGLHLDVLDKKVMFDHLEFNFIQYVRFFGRSKVYKQYSSKK